MLGMVKIFSIGRPVLVPYWFSVLAFGTGAVLAYVGHGKDFLHWQTSAGPVLVVGAGIRFWCGIGTCRS